MMTNLALQKNETTWQAGGPELKSEDLEKDSPLGHHKKNSHRSPKGRGPQQLGEEEKQ